MDTVFLQTERLILRRLQEEDFPDLAEMLQDRTVMTAWGRPLDRREVRLWLDNQYDRYRLYGFGEMAIIHKETRQFLGQAGLIMQHFHGNFGLEIAYMLKPRHWGHGYATEVASALRRYAFERLGARQVCCSIRDDNFASAQVARRLGMTVEDAADKRVLGRDFRHLLFVSRRPIVLVVDYDAEWPALFRRLELFLRPLLERTGLRVAHVGGTSLPGFAAQPVIDAIIGPHPNQLLDTNSLASMLRELGFRQDEDDELLFDKTSRLQFMHQLRICATAVDFQQQLDARNACAGLSPQQIHDLNLRKHEAARLYPNSPEDYDRAKRG
jgi:RimJ/RimL family protein N-acetyltransferase